MWPSTKCYEGWQCVASLALCLCQSLQHDWWEKTVPKRLLPHARWRTAVKVCMYTCVCTHLLTEQHVKLVAEVLVWFGSCMPIYAHCLKELSESCVLSCTSQRIWHYSIMYKIIFIQLPAERNYILGPDVFGVSAAKHAWKPHSWAAQGEWINNEQSHKMLVSIYQTWRHSPFRGKRAADSQLVIVPGWEQ